jgi:hypothetical protein
MSQAINHLFPGLPDYTGPTVGFFSLLHHQGPLVEWSDNVMERIRYIDREKPLRERDIRKAHIVYLDPKKIPAVAKRDSLYADHQAQRDSLYADIIAHIKPLIADFRWNGKELVFESAVRQRT